MPNRPDIKTDMNIQVIEGDDPCIVCLHDASINRSVVPNEWYWNFGDKITYCGFKLPGDDKLVTDYEGHPFDSKTEESLRYLLGVIGNLDFSMCPTCASSYGTSALNEKHYTGIYIRSSDTNKDDAPVVEEPLSNPIYRTAGSKGNPVERTGIHIPPESCGKTLKTADVYTHDTCTGQDGWGNGVYHIYKGAGVYPVYMRSWTRVGEDNEMVNRIGYTPMSSSQIPSGDSIVNYGIVVVKPRCPCFYGFNPDVTSDTELRCIGITNPNYSCRDDNMSVSDVTGYLESTGEDGLISAYAPFMRVGVSGEIKPMSFPIDKIYWDWCDWFDDFSDSDTTTYIEVPSDVSGWDNHWLGKDQQFLYVTGSHVYTIPGLYSLYFDYDYLTGNDEFGHDYSDIASAIEMVSMFTDIKCSNIPLLQDKFMLVEIPPRFIDQIIVGDKIENENGTELIVDGLTIRDVLRPGSYPIERVDWDFGDNTPVYTLYKNDYILSASEADMWDFSDESTSGTHFSQGYTYTFLNGCSANKIFEPFVEDYTIRHVYKRTNVDTGYMYTISCTAYAENTHTPATASITINGFNTPYPSFSGVEGDVRVVDTRNYGGSDDTIIVFNGSNNNELYHVKIED